MSSLAAAQVVSTSTFQNQFDLDFTFEPASPLPQPVSAAGPTKDGQLETIPTSDFSAATQADGSRERTAINEQDGTTAVATEAAATAAPSASLVDSGAPGSPRDERALAETGAGVPAAIPQFTIEPVASHGPMAVDLAAVAADTSRAASPYQPPLPASHNHFDLSILPTLPAMPTPVPPTSSLVEGNPSRPHAAPSFGAPASNLPPELGLGQAETPRFGPVRNRRGQHSQRTSSSPTALDIDFSSALNLPPDDLFPGFHDDSGLRGSSTRAGSSVDGGIDDAEGGEERTIKMGDHSFVIPLKSPPIAPQLQAHVRLTSTGKPSHARKVPENHVKRPRNAFILFRSYACTSNLLPETLGINDHRQVSRVVGQLWKGLKPEEKAIWEKKAAEEKEAHKLKNPNYRYRPVYRRENVVRRRRRKPSDDEEVEEVERKCEVVARVLLEGREVNEEELQKEVEEQRIKDQEEGRVRARSRSRSRSKSRVQQQHRPNSAPPGELDGQLDYDDLHHQMVGGHGDFLKPTAIPMRGGAGALGAGRSRAKTMPSQHDFMPTPFAQSYSSTGQYAPSFGGPDYGFSMIGRYNAFGDGMGAPSPRTAANLEQIFNAVNGEDPSNPSGYAVPNGLKSTTGDNVSLMSPSWARKFSLGRWEIPQTAAPLPNTAALYGAPGDMTAGPGGIPMPYQDYGASTLATPAAPQMPNYSYGTNSLAPESYAPPQQALPGNQYANPSATYVYLSKADAQNPEIVNHYLSQGFGVSYDA